MPRLLIISPTPHHKKDGVILGHGATVKEISYLGNFFQISHIAPLYQGLPPKSELPYSVPLTFIPVKAAGGQGFKKFQILEAVPGWLRTIKDALKKEEFDLIHIRTPSSFSLITLLFFKTHNTGTLKWIKFAGNWENNPVESITTKIQKKILKQGIHRSFVTVNYFKNIPEHFVPFPNPSIYFKEYLRNIQIAGDKEPVSPFIFAYVGALIQEKGIMQALMVIKQLKKEGIPFRFIIAGDGYLRTNVENFVVHSNLSKYVEVLGPVPHSEVFEIFRDAHFLLFPTYFNEGWPKVISEAMSMGVVPLAGKVSIIPDILHSYKIGQSIEANETEKYVNAIKTYIDNPYIWKSHSKNAMEYALFFTYEYYGLKLKKTLEMFGFHFDNGQYFDGIKQAIKNKKIIL